MYSQKVTLALAGGLSPGAKLRENRMVELTPTGIQFNGIMSQPQLVDLFYALRQMHSMYHLALADTIAHAQDNHGGDFVAQTLEQLEFDVADAVRANTIGLIALSARRACLTAEHYFVVGKAQQAEEITAEQGAEWLAKAEEHRLTPVALQASISAGDVVLPQIATARSTGIATIESVRFMFDQWKKKVEKRDAIANWAPDLKRKLLDELKPMVELAKQLEETL